MELKKKIKRFFSFGWIGNYDYHQGYVPKYCTIEGKTISTDNFEKFYIYDDSLKEWDCSKGKVILYDIFFDKENIKKHPVLIIRDIDADDKLWIEKKYTAWKFGCYFDMFPKEDEYHGLTEEHKDNWTKQYYRIKKVLHNAISKRQWLKLCEDIHNEIFEDNIFQNRGVYPDVHKLAILYKKDENTTNYIYKIVPYEYIYGIAEYLLD